jgi:TatD DNase family protein
MFYDMHCHCNEFGENELGRILESLEDLVIVAVSEDVESLRETIELSDTYKGRIAVCAGFHPWLIGERSLTELEEVLRMAYRWGITCYGEVGIDRKFVPQTWDVQVHIFDRILREARDVGALVNIHAPDAWADALKMLLDHEIERALFHWYTGPRELIPVIGEAGYKVSINAALKIQKKHQAIAREAPLEYIVTESDGPYNYRGLRLSPLMIPETIELIAKLKGVSAETVRKAVAENAERLLVGVID